MQFLSKNKKDTQKIAENFAKSIKKPSIILLYGDLGAGKTHFTKGLAKGLGYKDLVTSPTFTIMNLYSGGNMPIYHFDMYRLSSADEAREIGFEEYLNLSTLDGVSVVEWPENVKGLVNDKAIIVKIEKENNENLRKITIEGEGC